MGEKLPLIKISWYLAKPAWWVVTRKESGFYHHLLRRREERVTKFSVSCLCCPPTPNLMAKDGDWESYSQICGTFKRVTSLEAASCSWWDSGGGGREFLGVGWNLVYMKLPLGCGLGRLGWSLSWAFLMLQVRDGWLIQPFSSFSCLETSYDTIKLLKLSNMNDYLGICW